MYETIFKFCIMHETLFKVLYRCAEPKKHSADFLRNLFRFSRSVQNLKGSSSGYRFGKNLFFFREWHSQEVVLKIDGIICRIYMDRQFIMDCITILVSLINLGEQFGIFILQKVENVNELYERYFFFILFGIDGLDVFQCLFKNERNKTIVTMIVDTLEVICYVTILPRTSGLFLIAFLTYGFEILLNMFKVFLEGGKNTYPASSIIDESVAEKRWNCLSLPGLRLFAYILFQSTPLFFLFLQPDSKFRETYYETITIIVLYINGIIYGYLEPFWMAFLIPGVKINFKTLKVVLKDIIFDKNSTLSRVWFALIVICGFLLNILIFPITSIFLSSVQLLYNPRNMRRYDRGVYIYFIVSNTIWLVFLISMLAGLLVKLYRLRLSSKKSRVVRMMVEDEGEDERLRDGVSARG
jgi:hypothetical protein